MNKISILIVEDESRIRNLLRLFFAKEGWETSEAEDGLLAIHKVLNNNYDLIILDLMMPHMDGWELCKKIKVHKDIPIIMLTARGDENDRILGFEYGADDYVVKPFSPVELVLRVKALLKRIAKNQSSDDGILSFPGLEVNIINHSVKVDHKDVILTPLEFQLLTFLAENTGRVLTRDQLLTQIWGYDYSGETRTVDTSIKRLREKLNSFNPNIAAYIKTIWGIGYKFEVE